jgi:hypothetical protein
MTNRLFRFRKFQSLRRHASDASLLSNSASFPPSHASEGAAAVGAPAATSLAVLLTRHILRDGELIILLLKPSIWFILLSSMRFGAAVLILLFAAIRFDDRLPYTNFVYIEAAIFLIAGRLMFAVLQWTARLYVLTDLRIIRISGVFNVLVFDCPLRKVARTRLIFSSRERLLRLGSIEIIPMHEDEPDGVWQTIGKPKEVHEQVVAAINKARSGGCP